MVELVKKDDSVLAGSLALSAGVALWRQNSNLDLEPLLKVVQVEDLFAQADSFERQLSFDNDVAITYWFIKVGFIRRVSTRLKENFQILLWLGFSRALIKLFFLGCFGCQ